MWFFCLLNRETTSFSQVISMKIKLSILMAFILLPVSILSGCVKEKAPAVEKQPDDLGRYMQISENVDSRQDISMKKEEHTPKKSFRSMTLSFPESQIGNWSSPGLTREMLISRSTWSSGEKRVKPAGRPLARGFRMEKQTAWSILLWIPSRALSLSNMNTVLI